VAALEIGPVTIFRHYPEVGIADDVILRRLLDEGQS
jgi:hypothetical protein